MMNNEPIVCVCRKRGVHTVLENLSVVRSVLYTGIVALWFLGTYQSYSKAKKDKLIVREELISKLQKRAAETTKE